MSITRTSPKSFLGAQIPNTKVLSSKIDEIITQVNTNTTDVTTNTTAISTINGYDTANVGHLTTIEVTISKANILAMNGTPVTVVAAAGAGTALEFISAVLIYDYSTATYGGGGAVTVGYTGGAAITTTIAAADSFGAAGDKVFQFSRLNAAGGYTLPVNTALSITNATGAFTDPGTAAGVGRLQITYRVHTTGL